jgi:hypothetical protein
MSNSIPLHPTKGVNPALCFCPICGGDTNELALLGAYKIYTCRCGVVHYGRPKQPRDCRCGDFQATESRELRDGEKVPGGSCDKCRDILKTTNIVICPTCHRMFTGQAHRVLRAFEIGKDVKDITEAVAKGYAEVVVGQVVRMVCEECEAKESK